MKKLDKSLPFEEVIGGGANFKYVQDGRYFKACGSPCDREGKLLIKQSNEATLNEVANLNRNDLLVKPLILPERFDAKPKSLRKKGALK